MQMFIDYRKWLWIMRKKFKFVFKQSATNTEVEEVKDSVNPTQMTTIFYAPAADCY